LRLYTTFGASNAIACIHSSFSNSPHRRRILAVVNWWSALGSGN
jgi:hypothetical protein